VNQFESAEKGRELTRRQWLLILGGMGVVGFSGVVPELAAALSGIEGEHRRALPPGLYYPSNEHLFHVLHGLGDIQKSISDSETEYVKSDSLAFHQQFLSDEQWKVTTRVFEILLGKVDSRALSQAVQWLDFYLDSAAGVREAALHLDPLHRALAAAYHGETVIREVESSDPQDIVRSGFRALEQHSLERFGRGFLTLSEEQQTKLITTIGTSIPESPLRNFFRMMRAEAIRGYYTTRDGLQELDYKGNWYYSLCPGCEQK
jgi:hypothetical protein